MLACFYGIRRIKNSRFLTPTQDRHHRNTRVLPRLFASEDLSGIWLWISENIFGLLSSLGYWAKVKKIWFTVENLTKVLQISGRISKLCACQFFTARPRCLDSKFRVGACELGGKGERTAAVNKPGGNTLNILDKLEKVLIFRCFGWSWCKNRCKVACKYVCCLDHWENFSALGTVQIVQFYYYWYCNLCSYFNAFWCIEFIHILLLFFVCSFCLYSCWNLIH